jgi:hypothetical protein
VRKLHRHIPVFVAAVDQLAGAGQVGTWLDDAGHGVPGHIAWEVGADGANCPPRLGAFGHGGVEEWRDDRKQQISAINDGDMRGAGQHRELRVREAGRSIA